MPTFQVRQLDHVELYVPDRYAAAKWYEAVFGLTILREFESWANADGSGPLMISSDGGATKLALFQGEGPGTRPITGFLRVAFAVDGAGFLEFVARLDQHELINRQGERLTARDVVDHQMAWSIYFSDPYGNPFEVTTYDYDHVRDALNQQAS